MRVLAILCLKDDMELNCAGSPLISHIPADTQPFSQEEAVKAPPPRLTRESF